MPTPTPTSSITPSVTPSVAVVNVTGSTTFNMFNQPFNCNTVKKLFVCNSNKVYYVSDYLSFSNVPITTGDTFGATIVSSNGTETLCLTYDSDVTGSSNAYISSINGSFADCNSCVLPPTPTPTPTPTASVTPTPTLTPTPSMTPSPSTNSPVPIYVYSACTGGQNVIGLNTIVPGVNVGETFKFNEKCWKYVGQFNQPYSPPAGSIYSTFNTNIFGNPTTVYSDCDDCVQAPIPSPTPTPTPSAAACNAHQVVWNVNKECSPCDVKGAIITVYTNPSITVLSNNDVVYTNCGLTTTLPPERYIKSVEGNVFSVNSGGVLIFNCVAGGPC